MTVRAGVDAATGIIASTRGLFYYGARFDGLAATIRSSPGWQAKAHLALVRERLGPSDWLRGPGDDGAVVSAGAEEIVACGEAILPAFVERDPTAPGSLRC